MILGSYLVLLQTNKLFKPRRFSGMLEKLAPFILFYTERIFLRRFTRKTGKSVKAQTWVYVDCK